MNQDRLYTFECPECKKHYTYEEPGEPLCDGPKDRKEHEPKVMIRIRVKDIDLGTKEVSKAEGELRAKGALLTSDVIQMLGLRVKGKLWKPKDD